MTAEEYKELFETLDKAGLIETAINIALDNERLRKELDEKDGVIR